VHLYYRGMVVIEKYQLVYYSNDQRLTEHILMNIYIYIEKQDQVLKSRHICTCKNSKPVST